MENNQKEHLKKTLGNLAAHTEHAASLARDKLAEQMENEHVKKATQTASRNVQQVSSGFMAFWKKLSRRNRILLSVAAVFLLCVVVFGGVGRMAGGSGGKRIDSIEAGEKLVWELYPKSEYKLMAKSENQKVANLYFYAEPGQCWEDNPKIHQIADRGDTYCFHYQIASKKGKVANIFVAKDGRILGGGDLVDPLRPHKWIRIR